MVRSGWLALCLVGGALSAAPGPNLLRNPSFEQWTADGARPAEWTVYGGTGPLRRLSAVTTAVDGQRAALLEDDDPAAELGLTQVVPGEGEVVYQASVQARAADGSSCAGSYLQLRFIPSQTFRQVALTAAPGLWKEIRVTAQAPAGTTQVQVYYYSHRDPQPRYLLDQAALVAGAELDESAVPDPVPPAIAALKPLHQQTVLAQNGQPTATIIAPAVHQAAAQRLQAAVRTATGVSLPIASDTAPAAAVPLAGNVILLGQRADNAALRQLYALHFTLLDTKYPGPGGFCLQSLHSPFGDGRNALLVGGSDAAGVGAATDALIAAVRAAARPGALSLGWLQQIRLSPAYRVPTALADVKLWDASDGYGSTGYFGWNSLSKRLALYLQTGDPQHAREFLRLAFPDAATKDELARTDGEMNENKDDPLAGPYHYNAHQMILLWDLVEESPVFSDAERLRVTQALARQLLHRKDEGIYPLTEPPAAVGSRHGQWSAISLYCLARYFQTNYPHAVWKHALRAARLHFEALHNSAWVSGENDNLFWYNTATAPILWYLCLTGDPVPVRNGVLAELLRPQEVLASGQAPDWALRYGAITFFHQAAALTGDGRWLTYRDRNTQNLDEFRLGQSWWPDGLTAAPPADLVGQWTVQALAPPHWASRGSGLPQRESFGVASFRSSVNADGDYLLLDGFNGASRNPHHTFALLDLRIAGQKILSVGNGAYLNQVQTKADGLVEPRVAMDAALRRREVLGETAFAVGEVPRLSYANWRRSIVQRIGRQVLVVDALTFKNDSANFEATTLWQPGSGSWDARENAVRLPPTSPAGLPPGWQRIAALTAPLTAQPSGERDLVTLDTYATRLLRATAPGSWVEMAFELPAAVNAPLHAELLNYNDRGVVAISLDGRELLPRYDCRTSDAVTARVPLGTQNLAAGPHRLRVTVVERHAELATAYIGLVGLLLQAPDAAASAPAGQAIRPCDLLPSTFGADVLSRTWRGAVRQGGTRYDFTLLGPAGSAAAPTACLRLAPNAAVLRLPEPAVALVGQWQGCQGELLWLSSTHLCGLQVRRAGHPQPLLTASTPVDVDWNLVSGHLTLLAPTATTLELTVPAPRDGLLVDGAAREATETATGLRLELPAGRHTIQRARPVDTAAAPLAALLDEGRAELARQAAAQAAPVDAAAGPPPLWRTALGGRPTAVAVGGGRVFVAVDNQVHVLSAAGSKDRQLSVAGKIRVLHWWAEPQLLLVGCVDEQVIAFDATGARRWAFTSVMDPAAFRAAKQYWFKSAPGHEGIHGLGSGVFLNGQQQCFVGSACTVEVLDPAGQLVHRWPVFWGPGTILQTAPGANNSRNLLIARWHNDGPALAVINSVERNPDPRSFYGVPAGYDYVGGWDNQNRNHLLQADLDGDGRDEVVSEINGTWNRITVWDLAGQPLHCANLGPGTAAPFRNVRALALLPAAKGQTVAVALADGLLLRLDAQCRLLGSARLPAAAVTLSTAADGQLLAACDDRRLRRLDAAGQLLTSSPLAARPLLATRAGDLTVVLDDQGEVSAWR
ncbi:MAG: hypothetical protein IT204_22370 [Fimbriimonadaceae bacterium]|nr:hypothetical protein [Fimbriimonadaceae bacterium]